MPPGTPQGCLPLFPLVPRGQRLARGYFANSGKVTKTPPKPTVLGFPLRAMLLAWVVPFTARSRKCAGIRFKYDSFPFSFCCRTLAER